jgi:pimeloyl-ACP methyl ester carboxylesterase
MRMQVSRFFSVCLTVCTLAGVAQSPDFNPRFAVEWGSNAVGLKVVEQYDRERLFRSRLDEAGNPVTGERVRPLQTLIWYPAEKGSQSSMTAGDYLALAATEMSFGNPQTTPSGKYWAGALGTRVTEAMHSVRDAKPLARKYPVIIYSPSFSSIAWENADLCEYLASFGYVVIAAPGMGVNTRESTHDLEDAEAQAADVSFLIGFAHSLPDTDMTRIAAMGFSWGGLADVLAAAHDDRIDALVSLDGSERYFPGIVKASGYADPEKMKIPLIYFEEADQSVESEDQITSRFHSGGPSVLNAWEHGDLFTARMLGMFHPAFYSFSYRHSRLWQNEVPNNLQIADYDYNDCLLQFSWVMRYTRAFFDGYLKNDSAALAMLKASPTVNGVPKHSMSMRFRAATQVIAKPDPSSR